MTAVTTDLVVRKAVTVPRSPEDAFRLFTAGMGTWWPTQTHAIDPGRVREVVFEDRVGGEINEIGDDAVKAHWGTVLAFDPPRRVLLEWMVNPKNPPTEIEVRFTPEGNGTRVELEHRGWERYGDKAQAGFEMYDEGWIPVIAAFESSAST